MDSHRAFIGVGSNIEPETNILRALEDLAVRVRITAISTFYVTEALDRPEQPKFLNGVVRVETGLSAPGLKYDVLRQVEQARGRIRTKDPYSARTVDLDILLFDNDVINVPGLQIPDPDIRQRVFVAAPLLELVPDLVLPDCREHLSHAACLNERAKMSPQTEFTEMLKERLCL